MAVGATWPAIHRRDPAGCQRQSRCRGGRACPRGRLYASAVWFDGRHQHDFYDNLNFNFIRDIAPVAGIARAPHVMVVHPSFAANTVAEFIAYRSEERRVGKE